MACGAAEPVLNLCRLPRIEVPELHTVQTTHPGNVRFRKGQSLFVEQAVVNLERVRSPYRNHKVHHL